MAFVGRWNVTPSGVTDAIEPITRFVGHKHLFCFEPPNGSASHLTPMGCSDRKNSHRKQECSHLQTRLLSVENKSATSANKSTLGAEQERCQCATRGLSAQQKLSAPNKSAVSGQQDRYERQTGPMPLQTRPVAVPDTSLPASNNAAPVEQQIGIACYFRAYASAPRKCNET